jgi:uncharacterized protein YaiE (UPF0345 family)
LKLVEESLLEEKWKETIWAVSSSGDALLVNTESKFHPNIHSANKYITNNNI